ncbi:MAG TPA: hypothetical protein VHX60_17665 [Acidobacteriaceae bacterium]|nr:hypothetical protein [Acidobacteriaceae bacterium]
MAISRRPATWADIEPGLSMQEWNRGSALVGMEAARQCWQRLFRSPFFGSAVLEAHPPIEGNRLVGFGASVLVTSAFADAELAHPRPDINARIVAALHAGEPVVPTRDQVAEANAGAGIDVVVLCGRTWRYELLSPEQSHEAQHLLASGFAEGHAGYRMHRVLCESAAPRTREYLQRSLVFRIVTEFPAQGRALHCMTQESAKTVAASLGTGLFNYREPRLRLRESDQELLHAALSGATDQELAAVLGLQQAAVKARWRSAIARIAETMPDLVGDEEDHEGRGAQKRHRVLAWLRTHPEELRPYAWKG